METTRTERIEKERKKRIRLKKKKAWFHLLMVLVLLFPILPFSLFTSGGQVEAAVPRHKIDSFASWQGVDTYFSDPLDVKGNGQAHDLTGFGIANDDEELFLRWDVILGNSHFSSSFVVAFAPLDKPTNENIEFYVHVELDKGSVIKAEILKSTGESKSLDENDVDIDVEGTNSQGDSAHIRLNVPFNNFIINGEQLLTNTSKKALWGGSKSSSFGTGNQASLHDVVPNKSGTDSYLDYDNSTGEAIPHVEGPFLQIKGIAKNSIVKPGDIVDYSLEISNIGGSASTINSIEWLLPNGFTEIGGDGTVSWGQQTVEVGKPVVLNFKAEVAGNQVDGDYYSSVSITANDGSYKTGTTAKVNVSDSDLSPPTVTVGSIDYTNVTLDWNEIDEATSYNVFLNGYEIGTTTDTTYIVDSLLPGTTYNFFVTAVDSNGQRASNVETATTRSPGKITGTVTDGSLPIYEATVSLIDVSNNSIVETTSTNMEGNYSIPNITPGDYKLVVEKADHTSFTKDISIKNGDIKTVDATLLKEGQEPVASSINATGQNKITIPVDNPKVESYQATVLDQYGAEMTDASVNWSLQDAQGNLFSDPNITINSSTGEVTVGKDAAETSVKVVASSGYLNDSVDVTIEKAVSVVSEVQVGNTNTIYIPADDATSVDEAYSATVLDQYGDEMTGQTVEWKLTDMSDNDLVDESISINQNGTVSIKGTADEKEIKVKATVGSVSGTFDVSVIKAPSKETEITIDGPLSIAIPTSGAVVEDYDAEVLDQYGIALPGKTVTWSLADIDTSNVANNHVAIDQTGNLTVTSESAAGEIKVIATSGSLKKEVTVALVAPTSTIAKISIQGNTKVEIPGFNEETKTENYSITAEDQDGNTISDSATWELVGTNTGVTIDKNTGVLIVDDSAEVSTVTIRATSVKNPSIASTLDVELVKADSIKGIEIDEGQSTSFVIPAIGEGELSETYTATIKDQYGVVMDEDTSWSIVEGTPGVSIDSSTGKLTVPEAAEEGTIRIKATSVNDTSLTDTLDITLSRDSSSATTIEITGKEELNIPAVNAQVTESYQAIVKDQYGETMDGEGVGWSFVGSPSGIDIDEVTGLVTVYSNANAGPITVKAVSTTNSSISDEIGVTLKKSASVVSSITVEGDKSLTIPALGELSLDKEYSAKLKDQYGDEISEDVTWSLEEAVEGVSIDASTGVLTVTDEANVGSVVLVATSEKNENISDSMEVSLTRDASVVKSVEVTGNQELDVPTLGNTTTHTYQTTVKDQYGEAMDGEDVHWLLIESSEGVSINENNGMVTVQPNADPGIVTVKATVTSGDTVSDTLEVTLNKHFSTVASIDVIGEGTVVIPAQDKAATTIVYQSTVTDQYGTQLDDDVVWSLDKNYLGVSIDPATGVLSVTNSAEIGTITIVATVGGVTETKKVTLSKAASIVTDIHVSGEKDVTIPTQNGQSITTDYEAIVSDQYGDELGEAVTWSLEESAQGILINPVTGVLTVTDLAAEGTIHIVATAGKPSISVSYPITLTKDFTDEQAVDEALKNLKIDYEEETDTWESVTSNVFLLQTNGYGTDVEWSSSKSSVVNIPEEEKNSYNATATINRKQQDEIVIITATVSKGDIEKTRTFLLIVKETGLTKTVIENVRTVNAVASDGNTTVPIHRINVSEDEKKSSKIDKVVVTLNHADDITNKLGVDKKVTIVMDELPNDPPDEIAIEIEDDVVERLAENNVELVVQTEYSSFTINSTTLKQMRNNGLDLFFSVVPIKEPVLSQQVKDGVANEPTVLVAAAQAGGDAIPLGNPVQIHTNYSNYETTLYYPFTKNDISIDDLESLRMFIEHSDGEKVVRDDLTFEYDQEGNAIGVYVKINKFSTFTLFKLNTISTNPSPMPEPDNEDEPTTDPGDELNENPTDEPTDKPTEDKPGEQDETPKGNRSDDMEKEQSSDSDLPTTATDIFNLLAVGAAAILVGISTLTFNRRKKKASE